MTTEIKILVQYHLAPTACSGKTVQANLEAIICKKSKSLIKIKLCIQSYISKWSIVQVKLLRNLLNRICGKNQ